jgi:Homeodomain-like domain
VALPVIAIIGATVGKWRERYRQLGLDGLLDEPRVGAPREITDCQIDEVVTKTLESMPANGHSLSHARDGRGDATDAERHRANLACLRIAAPSCRRTTKFSKTPSSWRRFGTS